MSNYTKEALEGLVKKDLVKIASDLNLDTKGNRTDLINRIFEHKPSFEEMVESAPVSKDGDLNITVEETTNDIETTTNADTGEVTQTEENVEVKTETETEEVTTPSLETEGLGGTQEPVEEQQSLPKNLVDDNTAIDILNGWKAAIQNLYNKNVAGVTPARPATSSAIAEQLGVPEAVATLDSWKAELIGQLRPIRGFSPVPPSQTKSVLQIIKGL
jgi:hypothetical protein